MKSHICLVLIFLVLNSSLGLKAQISWFSENKKIIKKYYEFNKLKFAYEEALTTCDKSDPNTLRCGVGTQAQMIFEKKTISSTRALALVSLARKNAWEKEYPLRNQYVEEELKSGLGGLAMQRIVVYYLDNILWPVLIRAYDVVIDEHTCISITTKCDVRDWPAVEKTVGSIEASFSKK